MKQTPKDAGAASNRERQAIDTFKETAAARDTIV